ncbi:MAG: FIST C-terminal domain-containing protein [Deltaproteobacteria bacterium]|nr:FIST C-terminal domain-containing protein [Deltaproteobacteria bacterium]
MKTERSTWTGEGGWEGAQELRDAELVLYFAAPDAPDAEAFATLRERYPKARVLGCTTGGEIAGADVLDGSVSAIAIDFDAVAVRGQTCTVAGPEGSFEAGRAIAEALSGEGLRAVFVLSDGTKVNGTELVRGLRGTLGDEIVVTGGLAGDGAAFGATRVGLDEAPITGRVAAVGLYGDSLVIGCGSAGGWVPFGPERLVTKSNGNVLLELDNKPALELYKKYLGEEAARLPSSALLFPLVIRRDDGSAPLVRTIVGVDDAANTMTFAGDVPEGARAQLMRASHDELVDGAAQAAESARTELSDGFAVLVSCIGRKLLMGQSTADEVEAVADVLGAKCPTIGFYSYGEIAPSCGGFSDLHNQTMTITTFSERIAA